MAHGRQEIRLRAVGELRGIAGGSEILSPVGDLLFEVPAVRFQPLVTIANVFQHPVEPIDQLADLTVGRTLHRHVVSMALADRRHGKHQPAKRMRDGPLKAPGHGQSHQHGEGAAEQGPSQHRQKA